MEESCFVCGREFENYGGKVFDGILKEGIFKVCEKCVFDEHIPVVNKPVEKGLDELERKREIDKRLVRKIQKDREMARERHQKRENLIDEDVRLKDLVDKNFKKEFKPVTDKREDLIENFHWVIMRSRRRKKLTVSQLAKEINEPELAIKMSEQAQLGDGPNADRLLKKLQEFLGIRLYKKGRDYNSTESFSSDSFSRGVKRMEGVDLEEIKNLTISDLREMKKEKEYIQSVDEQEQLDEDEKEEAEMNVVASDKVKDKRLNKMSEDELKEQIEKDLAKSKAKTINLQGNEDLRNRPGSIEDGRPKIKDKNNISKDEIDKLIFGR